MAINKEPKFVYDSDSGHAVCTLTDGKHYFIGEAFCHTDDKDMMSEKTGCTIALMRAEIKYYTHIRDNEILPALKTLKHLYACISHGKHFNKLNHENVLIRRQIRQLEFDLTTVRQMINDEKKSLKTLIDEKDKFYKRVRANRSVQEDSVGQN